VKLVSNLDRSKYNVKFIALRGTPWLLQHKSLLQCEVKYFDYDGLNQKNIWNLFEFIKICYEIKKIKPDIAIMFFPTSYILGVLAAKLAGVKKIISTRRDLGLWLNKWNNFLFRFVNRYVDGIITNAFEIKNLVIEKEKFPKEKVTVIYNGIDNFYAKIALSDINNLKEQLGINPQGNIVGLVAGLRPMKRLHTFIKAARRVLDKKGDIFFIIIGDGPLREELESMVDSMKLSCNFLFAGWQNPILPYVSLFDIGVNCSANEGFSNAIMEYMNFGIPCIVSRAGGNGELIKDNYNGYLFELDNERELADKIIYLLENESVRKKFISNAKQDILDKYSIANMLIQYDRYFHQLLFNS
jgi:glycosyltransferase involved in cell wall biosynthesis